MGDGGGKEAAYTYLNLTIGEQKQKEKLVEKAKKAAENPDEEKQGSGSSSEDDSDEDKYANVAQLGGQEINEMWNQKVTVRNLRIREDTAKYLRNLKPDSAYYDPKSRSMRENPNEGKDPTQVLQTNKSDYVGDNFLRYSGDVGQHVRIEKFAWEAEKAGAQINLNSNPTEGEFLYRQAKNKKSNVDSIRKSSILEKYGGAEHLDGIPSELLLAQTEHYVEYSQEGRIFKGNEQIVPRSKYPEDM